MSELLIRIQKNVYIVSLISTVFLGFSIAYFGVTLIRFTLDSGNSVSAGPGTKARAGRSGQTITRAFRSAESFYSIASGNLIRDSEISGNVPEDMPASTGSGEITVLGMIAGAPSFARVAIQKSGENEVSEYKTGDEVAGYRIVAIHNRSISIERGGRRLKVAVGESSGEVAASQPAAVSQPASDRSSEDTKKITLTRDKLLSLMKDQSELYKNKFAPITGDDGNVLGYRMIFIPADNFLYQLGARSGDIIRRVNGEPLNSTEKMIEFYNSIKTVDRLTVDIERAGKIVSYEIVVR